MPKRPLQDYAGYSTVDLTAVQIHCLPTEDGGRRLVAFIPKTWEKGPKQKMVAVSGAVEFSHYKITSWEEVEIMRLPAAT
jgi:hypothetical protein